MTSENIAEAPAADAPAAKSPDPSPVPAPTPPRIVSDAVKVNPRPVQQAPTLPSPVESQLVLCSSCSAWKRLNPRAPVGECMKWRRFSGVTIITTDLTACSAPDPI